MRRVLLAAREATVLWTGDVLVLGSGLTGLSAALTAAERGLSTCLIEPGPTLIPEISRAWWTELPAADLCRELTARCRACGGMAKHRVDALVVDDVADNRELLSRMLQTVGVRVSVAKNGADALEQARRHPPDVIFMDVRMPVMDGIQAL